MKREWFFALVFMMAAGVACGQEAPELQRLRVAYDAAAQRALKPVTEAYLQELKKLKDAYAKGGKLDEALQVDAELQAITTKLAAMGGTATPIGARAGQTTILNARATIPPNDPDGYKFGPVRKGDVISLKYVEGKWKDHGILASFNPDEAKIEEASRLVISLPSKGGTPGDTVAIVTPGTVSNPFTHTVATSQEQLVLRINANSTNKANPGQVVYQLKITR